MLDDIYEYIIYFVDEGDIINMLSVNKKFYDEKILLRVMNKRFPFLSTFKKNHENWRHFYIKMLFSIVNLKKISIPYISHKNFNPYKIFSEKKYNYNLFLKYSIEIKDVDKIKLLIKKCSHFHLALESAVKLEDFNIINKLKKIKIEEFNYAFLTVVETGNKNLIKFFLDKGVDNFNRGLIGAVNGNNIEMVKFMINKGANNINDCLIIALRLNKLDIINFLTNKYDNYNINECLEAASEGGNMEMVKFMINKGADNFNKTIKSALKKNNIDIAKFLIQKYNIYNEYVLKYLIKNGNKNLVKLILEKKVFVDIDHLTKAIKYDHLKILILLLKYIEPSSDDIFNMMIVACKFGYLRIVNFLYDKIDEKKYFSIYVSYAARGGHTTIIQFFIEKGFNDYEEILSDGCMHFDIIKLMIEKGAKNFDRIIETSKNPDFFLEIKKSFLIKNDKCFKN